jgi:hypothetical protein
VFSRFDPYTGSLYYDKIDSMGRSVQHITEYFASPPVTLCNLTVWRQFKQELLTNQLDVSKF